MCGEYIIPTDSTTAASRFTEPPGRFRHNLRPDPRPRQRQRPFRREQMSRVCTVRAWRAGVSPNDSPNTHGRLTPNRRTPATTTRVRCFGRVTVEFNLRRRRRPAFSDSFRTPRPTTRTTCPRRSATPDRTPCATACSSIHGIHYDFKERHVFLAKSHRVRRIPHAQRFLLGSC